MPDNKYENIINSINNGVTGTVTRIHQMTTERDPQAAKNSRVSYCCDAVRFQQIDERSANNAAYLDFCVRIAESMVGDTGPITIGEILIGEKLVYHADTIRSFIASLPDPAFFDYIRQGNHKLLP